MIFRLLHNHRNSLLRESLYHCFAPLTIGEFRTSSVVERKVKDGPRARKPPIKSKGGKVRLGEFRARAPLRFVCRRQSATEKIHFDLDWRQVDAYSMSLVYSKSKFVSAVVGPPYSREIVSVPSYVGGGRFASIGPNKLNTAGQLSNRVVSLPQHECGRTRRFKEIEAWSRLYDKELCINYYYMMK